MTKPIQKIKNLWEDKTGVSPIIAVILMVAITVVLAATIYVWVSGFGGGGSQSISMAVTQEDPIGDGSSVTFRVDSVSSGTTYADLEAKTTTGQTTYEGLETLVSIAGDTLITAGDTFTINCGQGDTLTVRDVSSNSIALTKTIV